MAEVAKTNAAAVGSLLRELLASNLEYRRRWMSHTVRLRTREVSYAAVSEVVALYLWDQGLEPDTDRELPRRLRDRIRQAIRGERVTSETLTWIIESFEFDQVDKAEAWRSFVGQSDTDAERGVFSTLRHPPVPLIRPQNLRTIALFSRYYIGRDRSLCRIETHHIVVAIDDDVDSYAFSPRDSLTQAVGVAGVSLAGYHDSAPGFVGVEFQLNRPLMAGQHASLQYFTTHRPTPDPCTNVRRAARKRIDNVDLRVIFDREIPKRSYWCAWDDYTAGEKVFSVDVEVSARAELHQFLPCFEQSVVGFEWQW